LAVFFYNIFLLFFRSGITIASLWNHKARLWLNGRKNVFEKLESEIGSFKSDIIWIHCSSLGEFEQGRPVIEKIKTEYPGYRLLLTFFSPSGYEIRKNYQGVDWVFYLPLDSKTNAGKFLDIVNPALVVFVKYEYWYYYLSLCKKRSIPLLMVSAIFRKSQPFFKWYGGLYRNMLKCFFHFFVQDEDSKILLQNLKIKNVTIAGDTRFDRVIDVRQSFKPLPEIDHFCGSSKIFVAGSTWPNDEKIISVLSSCFPELKIIIAPHEIHEEHLHSLNEIFPDAMLYSQLKNNYSPSSNSHCLIIDNIGMLSKLYHYASITYIGGGFDKGIHNVLEAAVFGKPVIFGPGFEKFKEAKELIKSGGGFSIISKEELSSIVKKLLDENDFLLTSSSASKNYVFNNKGASDKILHFIYENRLLTR